MGKRKLTDQDKIAIRNLFEEGNKPASIAARFGVSRQTIHRVLNPDYYERNLSQAREYHRENSEQIQKRRANRRRDYKLSFSYKSDADVIDHLDKQENVNEYIRGLVVEDIKK